MGSKEINYTTEPRPSKELQLIDFIEEFLSMRGAQENFMTTQPSGRGGARKVENSFILFRIENL